MKELGYRGYRDSLMGFKSGDKVDFTFEGRESHGELHAEDNEVFILSDDLSSPDGLTPQDMRGYSKSYVIYFADKKSKVEIKDLRHSPSPTIRDGIESVIGYLKDLTIKDKEVLISETASEDARILSSALYTRTVEVLSRVRILRKIVDKEESDVSS